MKRSLGVAFVAITLLVSSGPGQTRNSKQKQAVPQWTQWRGPARDGQIGGTAWPARLSDNSVAQLWRVPLAPSYSGPIVSEDSVFVTETKDKATEMVRALDRRTGRERWKAEWPGAISVPFFAKRSGDWIRATPAYDGKSLYVAGMRDLLVSLDAKTGKENWRVDFVKTFNSPLPEFGFVSSPLVDGDAIYVQAANAVVKLNKATGAALWRKYENGSSIMESGAFSSPVIATIASRRQLIVQSRERLAGLDLATGDMLWQQAVPSFRGMNILTPVLFGDAIFTSSYQNKSWLYKVSKAETGFRVEEAWANTAQGYMSSPVVVDGHAYLHLANQRIACINLQTGERTWTSTARFGKYWSMVAQRDRILALDESGKLLLVKANPKEFELIDEVKIGEPEAWAHLAVCGEELFVRELGAMVAYRWQTPQTTEASR